MLGDEVRDHDPTPFGFQQNRQVVLFRSHQCLSLVAVIYKFVMVRVFYSSSLSSRTRGESSEHSGGGLCDFRRSLMLCMLMLDYIFTLVTVNVHTFLMAPWFEPKVLQPSDGSAD